MRFIHKNRRILLQIRIIKRFPKQNTISHVLNFGFLRCAVFESDRIPDGLPKLAPHLLRDSLCHRHRSHPSRLRASNDSLLCISPFKQVLSELCSLAASSFTDYDDNLVVPYDRHQVLLDAEHRQVLPLFLDSFRLRKLADRLVLLLQGPCVLRLRTVINLVAFAGFSREFLERVHGWLGYRGF